MSLVIVILHVLVCLVLILVILLQAGRGQGLTGASFGGGNVQSILGTKASSFLTKATSVCAVLFLLTCIGLNAVEIQKSRSLFHAPASQAPLDVDQIRQALDKIKQSDSTAQESATATADAVTAETESVKETSDLAEKSAENLLAEAVQKTDDAVSN